MSTTKEIALCENLSLNFDEATELFSSESLESMQLAKVNGGVAFLAVLGAVAAVAGIAAATITVIQYFSATDGPTQKGTGIEIETDGVKMKVDYIRYGDTLKVKCADGTVIWGTISAGPTK